MHSLLGQDSVQKSLKNATERDRLSHGLLFLGPDGVGREHAARLLAAGLLCVDAAHEKYLPFGCGHCTSCRRVASDKHPDVHFLMSWAEAESRGLPAPAGVDSSKKPSNRILVDQVRELTQQMRKPPYEGRARVAILLDAHHMNDNSANALLKTLEEPGVSSLLILTAPQVRSVLPTIASRCQRLLFRPLSDGTVKEILQNLGIERADERAARAEGSMAKAIAIDLDEHQGREAQMDELLEELLYASTSERLDAIESLGRDRLEVSALLEGWQHLLSRVLRRDALGESVEYPARLHSRNTQIALQAMGETQLALSRNAHVQLALEELFFKKLTAKQMGLQPR